MGAEYVCVECGGTFESGWTTEEAEAETLAVFGVANASRQACMVVVCDDCYHALMAGVGYLDGRSVSDES